jgi:hypothetical protein
VGAHAGLAEAPAGETSAGTTSVGETSVSAASVGERTDRRRPGGARPLEAAVTSTSRGRNAVVRLVGRWSLRTRLIVAFAAIIFLTLALVVLGFLFVLRQYQAQARELAGVPAPRQ